MDAIALMASDPAAGGSMGATLITFVLIILIFYFLIIRPQKKRDKQIQEMRSSLQVGDEIITIGGICGKIVKTKDESIVIQVGADKVKFEMMRWSVSAVVSSAKPASAPAEEEPERKKVMPKRLKKASAEEEEENIPEDEK